MSNIDKNEIINQRDFWQEVSYILFEMLPPANEKMTKDYFDETQEYIKNLEEINGRLKQKHFSIIQQIKDLSVIKFNAWPNITYGFFVDEERDKLYKLTDKQLTKWFNL